MGGKASKNSTSSAPERAPVTVEIPAPGTDRPLWSRVGIVGVVGFAIGVVWPRLVGISVGPDVPGKDRETTASEPIAAPAVATGEVPDPKNIDKASNKQQVVVGDGQVKGCRSKKDEKLDDCGSIKFDRIAKPRLDSLVSCPSALGLEGKLSIGFDINFDKSSVTVLTGDDTTLPSSTVKGIVQCAAAEFEEANLEKVRHTHPRYTIFYTAEFYPPGKSPVSEADEAAAQANAEQPKGEAEGDTGGMATVSWDTALVRKKPKDGDVAARLMRGTRVKLLERQDDWYRVDAGSATGWVYKQAIGLN